MKKINVALVALATLCVFYSCDKAGMKIDEKSTVSAFVSESKTNLDGYTVTWSEGDKFTAYKSGETDVIFTLTSGAGTKSGKFEGDAVTGEWNAFYPVLSDFTKAQSYFAAKVQDGNVNGFLAMTGTFSEDGKSVSFKHLCGVIRIVANKPVTYVNIEAKGGFKGKFDATSGEMSGNTPNNVMYKNAAATSTTVDIVCPPFANGDATDLTLKVNGFDVTRKISGAKLVAGQVTTINVEL